MSNEIHRITISFDDLHEMTLFRDSVIKVMQHGLAVQEAHIATSDDFARCMNIVKALNEEIDQKMSAQINLEP